MNRDAVLSILKSKKSNFHISDFILFGSYAKETHNQDSDIDIAFILEDGYKLNFEQYLALEEDLSQSFNRKIDLMNFKKINPLIKLDAQKDFIYV